MNLIERRSQYVPVLEPESPSAGMKVHLCCHGAVKLKILGLDHFTTRIMISLCHSHCQRQLWLVISELSKRKSETKSSESCHEYKKNACRLTTMAITKSEPFNSDNGHYCNTGFYFSLNFIFFIL